MVVRNGGAINSSRRPAAPAAINSGPAPPLIAGIPAGCRTCVPLSRYAEYPECPGIHHFVGRRFGALHLRMVAPPVAGDLRGSVGAAAPRPARGVRAPRRGRVAGPRGSVLMPPVHVIRYEGSWRPIDGVRVLRFMARCRCGWASGWVSNRSEAATAAAVHRQRPYLASVPQTTR